MLRKPYLCILAICFFCCEEAPDFGTIDSVDTPVVQIQTSKTTFTEFPIEIEWEGNTTAREFVYELQYVDDPSIPHSWSGSNTTSETSMTFELDPMNALKVNDAQFSSLIVSSEDDSIWYAQDQRGAIWELDLSFRYFKS